jgi:hypothetical protein
LQKARRPPISPTARLVIQGGSEVRVRLQSVALLRESSISVRFPLCNAFQSILESLVGPRSGAGFPFGRLAPDGSSDYVPVMRFETGFWRPAETNSDAERPTAWLRMQSEAKRSRGRIFPAICDLQGDFRKMQGEPILTPANLLMVSIAWNKFSRAQGAGRDCGCCREDFGKLQGRAAWNCEWRQGWRRFHFALAGLTMASVRKRTWKIANGRGESGCRLHR